MIELRLYTDELKDEMIPCIMDFWVYHGNTTDESEAEENIKEWTDENHKLYGIIHEKTCIGFIHLGSRGAAIDWIEDVYVKKEYRGKGYGSEAIRLAEIEIQKYSISSYLEVAAWNEDAIKLYRKLGYDCLNTVTLRKDFEEIDVYGETQLYGETFDIRKNSLHLRYSKEVPELDLSDEQRTFISSKEKIKRCLEDPDSMGFQIVYDDAIVGFIHVDKFENSWFLHNIFIDRAYQHKGIGKRSIRKLIAILKEMEFDKLYTTYIWGNDIAKHVYEELGFIESSVVDEDGIHEVNMVYFLHPSN